jgi:hypothetical protein
MLRKITLLSVFALLASLSITAQVVAAQGGGIPPRIVQVATRTLLSDAPNGASCPYAMARNWHEAPVAPGTSITRMKVAIGNFHAAGAGGETAPGGTETATCSIEYPAGTFNQFTFSGTTSIDIPPLGMVFSDWNPLSTPIPNGAVSWERLWIHMSSGTFGMSVSVRFWPSVRSVSSQG